MATLTEQLAAIRLAAMGDGVTPGRIPADVAAVMHRVNDDQRASGYRAAMPQLGTVMPAFSLPDSDGTMVEMSALLARGPLVVSFFRGMW